MKYEKEEAEPMTPTNKAKRCNAKHQRCQTGCPSVRADGTPSTSMFSLCLICFNTGCRIPLGDKPTIDEWVDMHSEANS